MAVTTTRINNGDGTITYRIDATALQATADAMAEDAARYVYPIRYQLYDAGVPIPFDSLTNAQKLAIIGREAKNHLVNCAKAYHVNDAVDVARETAVEESADYEIED